MNSFLLDMDLEDAASVNAMVLIFIFFVMCDAFVELIDFVITSR
jgi:hypothetical protein